MTDGDKPAERPVVANICPACKGSGSEFSAGGIIRCPRCDGRGTYTTCPRCHGSGSVDTATAGGDRRIACPLCSGDPT